MTAQVETIVLQNGLDILNTQATHITICAAEPTSYVLATGANALGARSLGVGNCFAAPSLVGTMLTTSSPPFMGETTFATAGTAAWWAVTDQVNTRLLAHGSLTSSAAVQIGWNFGMAPITISIPEH